MDLRSCEIRFSYACPRASCVSVRRREGRRHEAAGLVPAERRVIGANQRSLDLCNAMESRVARGCCHQQPVDVLLRKLDADGRAEGVGADGPCAIAATSDAIEW